jgi:translation initiation factor 1
MDLQIKFDNFEDDFEEQMTDKVTISSQQRNGKKSITTLYGLSNDLDLKKILKFFKKHFQCNGTINNDEKFGEIIQVSGDQKQNILNFLIDEQIYKRENIIIKGI